MNILDPENFLKEAAGTPVVDVRSPGEFGNGHIPGSINIPLFNDEERAVVGILYSKTGKQEAIEKGLDFVGPKMSEFIRQVKKLSPGGRILVYCWRGGMRSESMAWLFERAGMSCSTLKGGYKAYRNFLLDRSGVIPELIVIDGNTGSGKSEILRNLEKLGEQVIDLEKNACHRGSVFGGIGLPDQPSSQQFQNQVFNNIFRLNPSRRTWIEGESKSIGKVFLPQQLWNRMTESVTFEVMVPLEVRIKRLAEEYGRFPAEEMIKAIESLSKRVGEVSKNEIVTLFREGDLEETARRLLVYYDKLYVSNRAFNPEKRIKVELTSGDAIENSSILLEEAKKLEIKP